MRDGPGDGKGSDNQSTDWSVASLHKIIEHDKYESGFVVEKQTSEVCAYWRNNERVALAALRANKRNIYHINSNLIQNNESVAIAALRVDNELIYIISDKLKNTSTKVVKEIICKRIPMELDLENNIHITAATQCISDKGMGSYKHTIEHAENITPEQKLALQLVLIKYATDKDKLFIIENLGLLKQEYENLFNHIDQKTLLAIVEYEASFFEFIAPEKQTLHMAVVAYEDNKKMLQHIRKDLQRKNVISEMTTCHKKWFPFNGICLDELTKDY